MKAFRGKDGQIRIFRPNENALRLAHSARMISAPPVPEDLFLEAVHLAYDSSLENLAKDSVAKNAEFVPPYGLGASMYIRPLLLGSGPELGLYPPKEFIFVVYVTPGIKSEITVLIFSWQLLSWRDKTRGRINFRRLRPRFRLFAFICLSQLHR